VICESLPVDLVLGKGYSELSPLLPCLFALFSLGLTGFLVLRTGELCCLAPAEVVVKGFRFRSFWVHLHIMSAKRLLILCLLGAKRDN